MQLLLKLAVASIIGYAIYRSNFVAKIVGRGSPRTRGVRPKRSGKRKVGGMIASHALIWLLMNPVTLSIAVPILILALAVPLKIIGVPVDIPGYVMAVPRAAYERVKDLFVDKAAEAKAAYREQVAKAREALKHQRRLLEERERAVKAEAVAKAERLKAEAAEKARVAEAELNAKKLQALRLASETALKAAWNGQLWDGAPLPLRMAAALMTAGRRVAAWSAGEMPRLMALTAEQAEEQLELERQKTWLAETEAMWRSYRQSEPLSRMTLGQYRTAAANGDWNVEKTLVKKRKWRLWNRGVDAR